MRVITGIDHSVYVVGSEDDKPLKIGRAKGGAQKRLCGLQTGNPEPLYEFWSLNGLTAEEAQLIERQTHKHLADKKVRGEWFSVTLDEAIKTINQFIDPKVWAARLLCRLDTRGHVSPEDRTAAEELALKPVLKWLEPKEHTV